MFLLNSCLGLFSAASLTWRPFSLSYGTILPSSLTTLLPSALGFSPHPPVSVYGTGTYGTIAAFLDGMDSSASLLIFRSPSRFSSWRRFFLPPTPLRLGRSFHSRLRLSSRVPTLLSICSTGISTCYPSTTALALALGPDLPGADQLYPGNLGYSAVRILTLLSLLIPAFSLLKSPQCLSVLLRPFKNAPLPIISDPVASVPCFSPGHFRRRTSRPVSYYALFECVAASEPTSWLSLKSHILFHLTRTLGP